MKITDNRNKNTKFKDAQQGDVIRFVDDTFAELTYMVIAECNRGDGAPVNLVCLDMGGTLSYANDEENIEILNTELIIKR